MFAASYPEFSTMYLSDALPPQPFEMKLIITCGVMLMRYLAVLWCLYCDHVQDLASRSEGFSINSSKQVMMENKMVFSFDIIKMALSSYLARELRKVVEYP